MLAKNTTFFRRLLDDNIQRWNTNETNDDDDEDDDEEDEAKEVDEDLENSIFQKLGHAQPIPQSQIPDFQTR